MIGARRTNNPDFASSIFLTEAELADRRHSRRSLQRWRGAGSGPPFLRLGRRIVYRRSDVEEFEAAQVDAGGRS
jgi:hypothetical protein